jgi:hypothetical protein
VSNGNKEAVPMELVIAEMEVSEISESELETTFQRVVAAHKDAVGSIQASMQDADDAYRKYLNPDYIPLEDVAKEDRASLNKAEKNIAEQYSTLKKAYEKPLQNIEANIKQIRNAIKDASGVVDKAVKAYEDMQKSKKKQEIADYFATKKFDLVPLEKIFDHKWLNKGAKMKDVREELDEAVSAVYRDIETLERIPEHGAAAKAFYLENLDMGAALRLADILKENAERLAREQLAREERKMREQCGKNASAERQERRDQPKEEIVQSLVDQAVGLAQGTTAAQEREEIIEYTATFKQTREKLRELRESMTDIGVPYQKGILFESEDHAKQYMQNHNLNGKIYSFIYVPAA